MTRSTLSSTDYSEPSRILSPFENFIKRAMDIIIAITSLIISLPILVIVAIIIPIDSSGPVLIRQERVGKNGKSFQLIKFRSMFLGADKDIRKVLGVNPNQISSLKKQDDPRVTHAGRVIRRWSIDEFPQFWNVLCGDMSIVGPRPEERWIVELYTNDQLQRLTVKPGLTGPMQISGRGELDMDARLVLEMDYINNFSIWNDIKILIKTIPVVISGKGAF